jgi:uroporphyrinogen decarboxylase
MDSRSRVLTALDHNEPDRIPFDFGGTPFSGMHITAVQKLRAYLGLQASEVNLWDIRTQLGALDPDLLDRLGADCRNMGPRSSHMLRVEIRDEGDYTAITDEWGIGWRMPKHHGLYYDMYRHPMEGVETVEAAQHYGWLDPLDDGRFVGVRERAAAAREAGKAVVLSGLCAGITEMHAWLRGYLEYYTDFHLRPDLVSYVMDQVTEMKIAYWERMLSEVGDLVDVVIEADDMAGQERLLFSADTYRQFVKPRHARLFSAIKRRAPNVRILFHSCGAVRPLIGDLIEAGVDILNPVQKSARGMDLRELKREFGQAVVFWGGGVDTQHILPRGTPAEVREDVKRNVEALAPGGGFVFATIHNAQADVPPQNFVAMWEALQTCGVYSS